MGFTAREEQFLAAIASESAVAPAPLTREEELLSAIADAADDFRDDVRELEENQLPEVDGEDNGKILRVKSGKWSAEAAELPAVSDTDEGKALVVNGSGEWVAANILPTPASEDQGKVLMVVKDGDDYVWAIASLPA